MPGRAVDVTAVRDDGDSDDGDDGSDDGNLAEQLMGMLGRNFVEDGDEEWEDPSEGNVLTSVLEAAEEGDSEVLPELLAKLSVDINSRGADGDTALHLAGLMGNTDCVKTLLAAGAKADALDADGGVPMHDAAASGYLDIVKMLFESAPASVLVQDQDGDSPLHTASRGDHPDVVGFLLEAGVEQGVLGLLSKENSDGRTPVDLTTDDTTRALLEKAAAAAAD